MLKLDLLILSHFQVTFLMCSLYKKVSKMVSCLWIKKSPYLMDQMNKKTPLVNRSEKNPLFMEKKVLCWWIKKNTSNVDGSKKVLANGSKNVPWWWIKKSLLLMDQKKFLFDRLKKKPRVCESKKSCWWIKKCILWMYEIMVLVDRSKKNFCWWIKNKFLCFLLID